LTKLNPYLLINKIKNKNKIPHNQNRAEESSEKTHLQTLINMTKEIIGKKDKPRLFQIPMYKIK